MEELRCIFPLDVSPAAEPPEKGKGGQTDCSHFATIVDRTKQWKTSLLFQYAVTHATKGHTVVFISTAKWSSLPMPVEGMPRPEPQAMKHVKMLYMQYKPELEKYLASLHQQVILPHVVIVDELQEYVNQAGEDRAIQGLFVARFSALLHDTLQHMRNKIGQEAAVVVGLQESRIGHNTLQRYLAPLLVIVQDNETDAHTEDLYKIRKETRYDQNGGELAVFKCTDKCLRLQPSKIKPRDLDSEEN